MGSVVVSQYRTRPFLHIPTWILSKDRRHVRIFALMGIIPACSRQELNVVSFLQSHLGGRKLRYRSHVDVRQRRIRDVTRLNKHNIQDENNIRGGTEIWDIDPCSVYRNILLLVWWERLQKFILRAITWGPPRNRVSLLTLEHDWRRVTAC